MNRIDRMRAVMACLDETTCKELASFAAGNLVMVFEERTCWWCPADADDHSGEVIYTQDLLLKDEPEPEMDTVLREFFDKEFDSSKFYEFASLSVVSRPCLASRALEAILTAEAARLMGYGHEEADRIRAAKGSILA